MPSAKPGAPQAAPAAPIGELDGIAARASSSSMRASAMSWSRRALSFCRHFWTSERTESGVAAGRAFQSGSRSSSATIVSERVSAWNARRPVSASYSTQPKDQMSLRLSSSCPRACSGLM